MGTGFGRGRVFFSDGAGGGGQEEWTFGGTTGVAASGLRSKGVGFLFEGEAAAELEVLAEEIAAHDVRYYQASLHDLRALVLEEEEEEGDWGGCTWLAYSAEGVVLCRTCGRKLTFPIDT